MGSDEPGRLTLMLITNEVEVAAHALASGVNRIFVDLEVRGKDLRQGGLDTHRSAHSPEDVERLRRELPDASLMARINPLYSGSAKEVEAVVDAGADRIMLPMFKTAEEAGRFLDLVGGRTDTVLLLETPQALTRVDSILAHRNRIGEIHVGLNDLHLGMGLSFMFELLSGGIIEYLAAKVRGAGVRFGFGGIARVGEGAVPAELILGEHVRLGSEMVILSRSFHGRAATLEDFRKTIDLPAEIRKVRYWEEHFRSVGHGMLDENRLRLIAAVHQAVETVREADPGEGA